MNQFDISVTIAVIMDGLLGIAYLGFSAFLLSFKEFPYTICGILVFLYVLTSYGNVTGSLGSVFNTGVGKKGYARQHLLPSESSTLLKPEILKNL